MDAFRGEVEGHFRALRDRIVAHLQQLEGPSAQFQRTSWQRPGGGGGEMSVRYLEVGDVSWFGGGMDLTPFAPFPEDTEHFHGVLRDTCGPDRYARFSQWAREYFFIAHRHSERGVGGVFFDYLRGREQW